MGQAAGHWLLARLFKKLAKPADLDLRTVSPPPPARGYKVAGPARWAQDFH